MKIKIFSRPWSLEMAERLEGDVNAFLADIPSDAVKHVDTQIVAARGDDGTVKSESIIVVWYEGSSLETALPRELKDLEAGAQAKAPGLAPDLDTE
jgi:hypothetical protein